MIKIFIVVVAIILCCGTAIAGEKEEIALRIQIVQEHIMRLNESLHFIPYEKKVYEDAMNELLKKQAEQSKPPASKGGE